MPDAPMIYTKHKPARAKFYTVIAHMENEGMVTIAKTRYSKHAEMIADHLQQLKRINHQEIKAIYLDI